MVDYSVQEHIKRLKKLQQKVNQKSANYGSAKRKRARRIIEIVERELDDRLTEFEQDSKAHQKLCSRISEKFASDPYHLMFRKLDRSLLDSCSLKIDACEDFLTDSFTISTVKIFHRLDFFSVFLGFDGWNEAVFFDFEVSDKTQQKESEKQALKELEKQRQEQHKVLGIFEMILQDNIKILQKDVLNQFTKVHKEKIHGDIEKDTEDFIEATITEIVASEQFEADLLAKIEYFFNPIELKQYTFYWHHRAVLVSAISLSLLKGWQAKKVQLLKRLLFVENSEVVQRRSIIGMTIALLVSYNNDQYFIDTLKECKDVFNTTSYRKGLHFCLVFLLKKQEQFIAVKDMKKFYHLFKLPYVFQYLEPIHSKTSLFQIKLEEKSTYFLKLLKESISLSYFEKLNVFLALPRISQSKIDVLITLFLDEKKKFRELESNHPNGKEEMERLMFDRRYLLSLQEFIAPLIGSSQLKEFYELLYLYSQNINLGDIIYHIHHFHVLQDYKVDDLDDVDYELQQVKANPNIENSFSFLQHLVRIASIKADENYYIETVLSLKSEVKNPYWILYGWCSLRLEALKTGSFFIVKLVNAFESKFKRDVFYHIERTISCLIDIYKTLSDEKVMEIAFDLCASVLKNGKREALFYVLAGDLYKTLATQQKDKYIEELALKNYQKSLSLTFDLEVLYKIGCSYFVLGEFKKTEKTFKKLLQDDTLNPRLNLTYAHCFLIKGETSKAAKHYQNSMDNWDKNNEYSFFEAMDSDYTNLEEHISKKEFLRIKEELIDASKGLKS